MEMAAVTIDCIETQQEFELQPLSEAMLVLVGGGEGVVMTT